MKNFQNPQPQAVNRKKKNDNKKRNNSSDNKLDKKLKDTFPASDSTTEY